MWGFAKGRSGLMSYARVGVTLDAGFYHGRVEYAAKNGYEVGLRHALARAEQRFCVF